ncbi:MAG TPA: sigma-70 factor domain-containing protein, partial [Aggregatilineales bacterium]|nr:sigma-70 factor domain-containing protein [Aggregatilineales bacterium]
MAKHPGKRNEEPQSPEGDMAPNGDDKLMEEPEEVLPLFDDSDDDRNVRDQLEEMGIDLADGPEEAFLADPDEDDLVEIEEENDDEAQLTGAALADDPVRMYLKEIGQVQLLDPNHETWLSSQMAAVTLLNMVTLQAAQDGHTPD